MLRVLIFVLLLAANASAGEIHAGRFTVYALGREAGYELVSRREKGGRVTIDARAIHRHDDREQDLRLELVLDGKTGELIRFEATGRAGDKRKTGMFAVTGGDVVGEVRNGESSAPFRFARKKGMLVLAEPFAAPWLIVAARYDRERGEPQTFPVLFPLEGRVGTVTVTRREDQAIEVDRQVYVATRLLAVPDRGHAANLWLAEDGRVLVCARSVAGISAVRGTRAVLGLKPGSDPPDLPGVQSTRIRFSGAADTLAGTWSRPKSGDGPFPAVLILSGSGPQDRNGNAPGTELQWNHLHSIAMALARAGVASLRYDERGVGKSGGTFFDAGLGDLVADAGRALSYLETREDVDPRRILVLGHSEGALHAALLTGAKGSPVRAAILIGAPAEPLDRILLSQVAARLKRREAPRKESLRILGDLRAFHEHVRLSTADVVTRSGRRQNVRWLREHMDLDPRLVYSAVRVPVLLLHGGRDLQVPSSHATRIRSYVGESRAEIVLLPNLDHFLILGRGTIGDYADARRRVDADALTRITGWIDRILR